MHFYAACKHSSGKVWPYKFSTRAKRAQWLTVDSRRFACTKRDAERALQRLNANRVVKISGIVELWI